MESGRGAHLSKMHRAAAGQAKPEAIDRLERLAFVYFDGVLNRGDTAESQLRLSLKTRSSMRVGKPKLHLSETTASPEKEQWEQRARNYPTPAKQVHPRRFLIDESESATGLSVGQNGPRSAGEMFHHKSDDPAEVRQRRNLVRNGTLIAIGKSVNGLQNGFLRAHVLSVSARIFDTTPASTPNTKLNDAAEPHAVERPVRHLATSSLRFGKTTKT